VLKREAEVNVLPSLPVIILAAVCIGLPVGLAAVVVQKGAPFEPDPEPSTDAWHAALVEWSEQNGGACPSPYFLSDKLGKAASGASLRCLPGGFEVTLPGRDNRVGTGDDLVMAVAARGERLRRRD
jgi:hypothetical protein